MFLKSFSSVRGVTSYILAHRRGFGSDVPLFRGPPKFPEVTPPSKMAGVPDGQEFKKFSTFAISCQKKDRKNQEFLLRKNFFLSKIKFPNGIYVGKRKNLSPCWNVGGAHVCLVGVVSVKLNSSRFWLWFQIPGTGRTAPPKLTAVGSSCIKESPVLSVSKQQKGEHHQYQHTVEYAATTASAKANKNSRQQKLNAKVLQEKNSKKEGL